MNKGFTKLVALLKFASNCTNLLMRRYLPAIDTSPPDEIVTAVAPFAIAVTVTVSSSTVRSGTLFLPRTVMVPAVEDGIG